MEETPKVNSKRKCASGSEKVYAFENLCHLLLVDYHLCSIYHGRSINGDAMALFCSLQNFPPAYSWGSCVNPTVLPLPPPKKKKREQVNKEKKERALETWHLLLMWCMIVLWDIFILVSCLFYLTCCVRHLALENMMPVWLTWGLKFGGQEITRELTFSLSFFSKQFLSLMLELLLSIVVNACVHMDE